MSDRNPLDGFVLYKNEKETVKLTVGKDYVRVSSDALRMIGDPDYINIFFDEQRQRMAVKASDKTMPNTFAVTSTYGVCKCGSLRNRILEIADLELYPGEVVRFSGSKCSQDYVIFNLKKGKVTKFDLHLANMVKATA